jgi:hypothetical protein
MSVYDVLSLLIGVPGAALAVIILVEMQRKRVQKPKK